MRTPMLHIISLSGHLLRCRRRCFLDMVHFTTGNSLNGISLDAAKDAETVRPEDG